MLVVVLIFCPPTVMTVPPPPPPLPPLTLVLPRPPVKVAPLGRLPIVSPDALTIFFVCPPPVTLMVVVLFAPGMVPSLFPPPLPVPAALLLP
uniref:Putative secreted protein n=1 Tax=Anopheles darlingi TaxID=43151 RepID=A0A2M4D5F1_ANODA